MRKFSVIEKSVLKLIPKGKVRKISGKEIEQVTGLDTRSVYVIINNLRKQGVPICAKRDGEPGDRGYYIATTEAERAEGLAPYKAQVADMLKLIREVEKTPLE